MPSRNMKCLEKAKGGVVAYTEKVKEIYKELRQQLNKKAGEFGEHMFTLRYGKSRVQMMEEYLALMQGHDPLPPAEINPYPRARSSLVSSPDSSTCGSSPPVLVLRPYKFECATDQFTASIAANERRRQAAMEEAIENGTYWEDDYFHPRDRESQPPKEDRSAEVAEFIRQYTAPDATSRYPSLWD
ncbi:hypothetical protein TWF481_006394 [Arthrobotrys musiformis]|uniref:Uncharacterized protein n=1 Tax=Arthrobotrys musiformis TaxID=47236 RepID=A0AAV9WHW7_9PEZI